MLRRIFLPLVFLSLVQIAFAQSEGIGGFDLASPNDRVFSFDYDSSGKQDHLVLYGPGAGTITEVLALFG